MTEYAPIRVLRWLGDEEDRRNLPVGRAQLIGGLQRLFDVLVTAAMLCEADDASTLPIATSALLGLTVTDP